MTNFIAIIRNKHIVDVNLPNRNDSIHLLHTFTLFKTGQLCASEVKTQEALGTWTEAQEILSGKDAMMTYKAAHSFEYRTLLRTKTSNLKQDMFLRITENWKRDVFLYPIFPSWRLQGKGSGSGSGIPPLGCWVIVDPRWFPRISRRKSGSITRCQGFLIADPLPPIDLSIEMFDHAMTSRSHGRTGCGS